MDQIDLNDLNKKYAHTFLRIRSKKEGSGWFVCKVEEFIVKEEGQFSVRAWISEESRKIFSSKTHYFEFAIPQLGVINFKNSVVITARFPARQWKRTICKENFVIFEPTYSIAKQIKRLEYVLPEGFNDSFRWSLNDVKLLFNSMYYSFEDAVTALQKGEKFAVALDQEWFLTNSFNNDSILLWNTTQIVAEIRTKFNKCSVLVKEMEQEVLDFIRRNNLCLYLK